MQVFLSGISGSGKSTVGRLLANDLKVPFIDTDREIEKRLGMKVEEVFRKRGEPFFRKVESEILREIIERNEQTVVALGGGIIERKENRKLLKKKQWSG